MKSQERRLDAKVQVRIQKRTSEGESVDESPSNSEAGPDQTEQE